MLRGTYNGDTAQFPPHLQRSHRAGVWLSVSTMPWFTTLSVISELKAMVEMSGEQGGRG